MHAMQDEGGAPLSDGAGRGGRHTLVWTTFAVAIFTLLADQGTKVWALAALEPGRPVNVIGDVLRESQGDLVGGRRQGVCAAIGVDDQHVHSVGADVDHS